MYMKELELLPEQLPSLRDCGFYVSGFNRVVDTTMLPLGMVVMKASPRTLGRPYARLLAWSLRRFSRPPYGTVFQAEAEGEGRAGEALSAGLRVTHSDGYWLTAAAAAACLLQWADGSLREPGVHLQALAADPARLLRDLHRMGAGLEGRGVEVADLLGDTPRPRLTPRLRRPGRALAVWAIVLCSFAPGAPRISSETTRRRFASAAVLQGDTREGAHRARRRRLEIRAPRDGG